MIPAARAHLYVSAASHPGLRGKGNEDRYGVSAYWVEDEQQTPALLAVLADGIGGHRAGEVAAELAVETISRMIAESDASDPLGALQQAIIQTGRIIHAHAQTDPLLTGMGSTVACAWIVGMLCSSPQWAIRASTWRAIIPSPNSQLTTPGFKKPSTAENSRPSKRVSTPTSTLSAAISVRHRMLYQIFACACTLTRATGERRQIKA